MPFLLRPDISSLYRCYAKGVAGRPKIELSLSLARIIPYLILSVISAVIAQLWIQRFYQSRAGLFIYLSAGALISLLGILIMLGKSDKLHCRLPFKKVKARGLGEMILLGIMVGFAPCLPLLGVLAYIAFNAQNILQGGLLGLSFGAGTLFSPLVLFGPIVAAASAVLLKRPLVYNIVSRACGLVLLYFGTGIIIKGL